MVVCNRLTLYVFQVKQILQEAEAQSAKLKDKDDTKDANGTKADTKDKEDTKDKDDKTVKRKMGFSGGSRRTFFRQLWCRTQRITLDELEAEEEEEKAAEEHKREKKKKKDEGMRKKVIACGKCEGCKLKACKKCAKCTATPKKRCLLRKCTDMRIIMVEDEPKKVKADADEAPVKRGRGRPRIHIKLPIQKDGGESDKKKTKKEKKEKKAEPKLSDDPMFDIKTLESEHAELEGATWKATREFATKHGRWRLPSKIESENAAFKKVAILTLFNLSKIDYYDIFAQPVDEEQVPGYYEQIAKPMDFSAMKSKIEKGKYGKGSNAAAKFHKDFLLIFDNCHAFNFGVGDVVNEAMLVMKAMPLTYAKCCCEVAKGGSMYRLQGGKGGR